MKKNILQARKALLALFAMLLPLLANAEKVLIDDIWYNLEPKIKQAEVTSPNYGSIEYSGDIIIPATITYEDVEYSVTSIGKMAFNGCSNLQSINLPESVTSIEDNAFYQCNNLQNITIPTNSMLRNIGNDAFCGCSFQSISLPKSVANIGKFAFRSCKNLLNIAIPEGVTSILYNTFNRCSSLQSISLPKSLTSIENSAFSGCSNLTSITLPKEVKSLGNNAFDGCSSLTAITLPEGMTSIGEHVFYGCSRLENITIPDDVTSIGRFAFSGCSSLQSITIPENVTSIGEYAFRSCENLTAVHISSMETWCRISFDGPNSNPLEYAHDLYLNGELVTDVIIPEGMTTIKDRIFYGCSSLQSITIPESVTSIGGSAFYGCSGLQSVTIPENVKSIGSSTFNKCSSLTDVYCYAKDVPKTNSSFPSTAKMTLHVPACALDNYKADRDWQKFGNIIALTEEEMGTTGIEPSTLSPQPSPLIYSLTGRRVTDIEGIKGIYIANGKKIVIK